MNIKKQNGFTLVEVLVSIAIGAFLLSMVVTVFLGARATSKATTGIARSQESTRFASYFINRDLRLSGFFECSKGISLRDWTNTASDDFVPSIPDGVFGWEFTGTGADDNYDLDYQQLGQDFTDAELTAARASNSAAASSWTGSTVLGFDSNNSIPLELPAAIAALNPMRGSDIVVTSISVPLEVKVEANANLLIPTLSVVDEFGISTQSDIAAGTMLKIGDCSSADSFQNYAPPGDFITAVAAPGAGAVSPGNAIDGTFQWQKKWSSADTVYETKATVYYIGTGASGQPALFSFSTKCGFSDTADECDVVSTELVDGVENMQLLYGEDLDGESGTGASSALNPDNVANAFLTADQVGSFRRVVSIKVGLVVRSPDAGLDIGPNTTFPEFEVLDQVTINPPDDANQRFVNNTTLRLRNRGL